MSDVRSPAALLVFRRRILAVAAMTLAVGMGALALVVPLVAPAGTWVDGVVLGFAAAVHLTAARTVGRRWEPGGVACGGYLAVVVVLFATGVALSSAPESDAFWFCLVPLGLSAMTMSRRAHAAITALTLTAGWVAAGLGPGLVVSLVLPRSVAATIFAVALWALSRRLEHALVDVEQARATLEASNAELARINERLEEVDRARESFVATVAHELRTPLTVVVGTAETIRSNWDQLDDDAHRMLGDLISRNARALEGIVSTMLDLARIERGGFEPDEVPLDLVALVDDSLARLAPVLEHHRVSSHVPPGTTVVGDVALLERVVDNLLTNAARHTPAGTSVQLHAEPVDGGTRISVRDAGAGMAAGEVERLGEPFYRPVNTSVGQARDGVGIGLALVGDILAALGSELLVTSEQGAGSTFAFVLPTVTEPGKLDPAIAD